MSEEQKDIRQHKYLRLFEKVIHELRCFGAHYWRMPGAGFLGQEHLHGSSESLPYWPYDRIGRSCSLKLEADVGAMNYIPYRANAML